MTEVGHSAIHAVSINSKLRMTVSRLYAHSKNYDMDLTLDYNIELFPLKADQSIALALASSLARGPPPTNAAGEEEEKDVDAWRPDGKGRRGLEEDYDYVMYGKVRAAGRCIPTSFAFSFQPLLAHTALKVYRFDEGTAQVVYVLSPLLTSNLAETHRQQDCIHVVWWPPFVSDGRLPTYVKHRTWRSHIRTSAEVVHSVSLLDTLFIEAITAQSQT